MFTPLDASASASPPSQEAQNATPPQQTVRIAVYAVTLLLLFQVSAIGVHSVPLQFLLKDTFKLTPQQLSVLSLLTDIPVYLGFAFGFVRDR